MKKSQLKQIIKEEVSQVLKEDNWGDFLDTLAISSIPTDWSLKDAIDRYYREVKGYMKEDLTSR